MEAVTVISGRGAPLRRSDVDTDQIIPAEWLKRVERTGFGAGLFAEWRKDPDFVLNDERYAGATVLVAGANFGTGSSREHATWALQDHGFRAVVSPRFADIFRNNCLKIGLVPVEATGEAVSRLLDALEVDAELEIVVDVTERRLRVPALDLDEPFHLDDHSHFRLVNGLDDIGLTLRHESEIASYEQTRPAWMPLVPAER
ncbi:MAG: 3-isopropylmalate dehydratase small subunit [Acidimicrobiia bacterium]|nr:3-isopropylmalate dehydratase small subunit [Acidimicrobiia bacterium]